VRQQAGNVVDVEDRGQLGIVGRNVALGVSFLHLPLDLAGKGHVGRVAGAGRQDLRLQGPAGQG
jgi:hypothetical protein